jgi:hypothetical protein
MAKIPLPPSTRDLFFASSSDETAMATLTPPRPYALALSDEARMALIKDAEALLNQSLVKQQTAAQRQAEIQAQIASLDRRFDDFEKLAVPAIFREKTQRSRDFPIATTAVRPWAPSVSGN